MQGSMAQGRQDRRLLRLAGRPRPNVTRYAASRLAYFGLGTAVVDCAIRIGGRAWTRAAAPLVLVFLPSNRSAKSLGLRRVRCASMKGWGSSCHNEIERTASIPQQSSSAFARLLG